MNLYLSKKKKRERSIYFGTRSAKKSPQMIYCLTFDNNAKRNTAGLMCFDFVKPFCTRDPLCHLIWDRRLSCLISSPFIKLYWITSLSLRMKGKGKETAGGL